MISWLVSWRAVRFLGKVATRLLAAVGLGLGLLRLVYLRRVGVRISEGGLVRVRVRATVTTIRKVSVKASRSLPAVGHRPRALRRSGPKLATVRCHGQTSRTCRAGRAGRVQGECRDIERTVQGGCREGTGRVQGGWVECREGRVHLRHELSTGGRSAWPPCAPLGPDITWPWCVVRSVHPASITGPAPQLPHWRASGNSKLSSCFFCITCQSTQVKRDGSAHRHISGHRARGQPVTSWTLRATGSSVFPSTYFSKLSADTCAAMSRSGKGRAASQPPCPCSGQKHPPPSAASRPSFLADAAVSASAARPACLPRSVTLLTTYFSRQSSHVAWLAAHVIPRGASS